MHAKWIFSKGETLLECPLVTQTVLAAEIMENLPDTQARSASTDMFSNASAQAANIEEFCRTIG